MITDNEIEIISHKLSSINTLNIYIERYNDDGHYSIVAADEENGCWIELFAESHAKAHEIAKKLSDKIIAEY